MSQKALKRKIRRGTDDSDSDFKLPAHYAKKDSLNSSDEGVKTRHHQNGNGSNEHESDSDDNISLKNLINAEDNNDKCDSPSRSRSVTPKTNKPKETMEQQCEQPEKEENCSNGNENGAENGQQELELKIEEDEKTNDMEPLLLDADPLDPELMFPEEESGSDMEAGGKGSPILSRSVTRRSHSRNIPTPKTPKSMHENGSETPEQCPKVDMNPVISVERLSETAPPQDEDITEDVRNEPEPVEPEEIFVDVDLTAKNDQDFTLDSCESASEVNESMLVNITGDDATRNIDFSCKDPSILDESTESQRKNRSRLSLSSRRSIRPNSDDIYRRKAFHNAKEGEWSSAERPGSGMKRKQRSTTPDGPKRYKLEPDPEKSPGFLSYLSSPIYNLKNRFTRMHLPTSTPILKGYKANPLLSSEENTDGPEQELDETSVIPERKWCAIM